MTDRSYLEAELDELAASHPNLTVHYTVDSAGDDGAAWDGSVGFVTADMIKAHLPAPSESTRVAMCGPPAMTEKAIKPALEQLGYAKDSMLEF